jgi:hypothetical protein
MTTSVLIYDTRTREKVADDQGRQPQSGIFFTARAHQTGL